MYNIIITIVIIAVITIVGVDSLGHSQHYFVAYMFSFWDTGADPATYSATRRALLCVSYVFTRPLRLRPRLRILLQLLANYSDYYDYYDYRQAT